MKVQSEPSHSAKGEEKEISEAASCVSLLESC